MAAGSEAWSSLRAEAEKIEKSTRDRGTDIDEPTDPAAAKRLIHELRVHQIELEMQNGELRQAQVELDAARERYFDLYSLAPVGYLTLDGDGIILEANLTAASLLGVTRSELTALPFTRFIARLDQDVFYLQRKRLIESGGPVAFELRLAKPDGTSFWARLEGVMAEEAGGKTVTRFTLGDISDRRSNEEALRKAFIENRNLLKELQHRAKNSFNMIYSMISLAARNDVTPEVRTVLEDLGSRVWSISELYSLLYSTGTFDRVRLDDYFSRIAAPLIGLSGDIRLVLEMESIEASAKEIAPVGLMLTELLTNSLKHAFPDRRQGSIRISLRKTAEGASLEVRDDGVGMPSEAVGSGAESTGLNLVRALADQVGGNFSMVTGAGGTRCSVTFSLARGGPAPSS
jgi:PAS domain S-box-containing protein